VLRADRVVGEPIATDLPEPMFSLIEYDDPVMPGIESDTRAIAFTLLSASDQNSVLWRMKVIVSMLFKIATPRSPLPRSGASVVPVVSTSVGGALKVPLYCPAIGGMESAEGGPSLPSTTSCPGRHATSKSAIPKGSKSSSVHDVASGPGYYGESSA